MPLVIDTLFFKKQIWLAILDMSQLMKFFNISLKLRFTWAKYRNSPKQYFINQFITIKIRRRTYLTTIYFLQKKKRHKGGLTSKPIFNFVPLKNSLTISFSKQVENAQMMPVQERVILFHEQQNEIAIILSWVPCATLEQSQICCSRIIFPFITSLRDFQNLTIPPSAV